MEEFIVFKKYTSREDAAATLELLQENHIPYECDDNVDSYFRIELGSLDSLKGMYLKLLPKDFERARAILKDEANEWIADLPKDYYLFDFSDKELLGIIQKPDEWNEVDYELAKKILAERGIPVDSSAEKKMYEARLGELSKPISASWLTIITTFIFIPFLYGMVMSWQMAYAKKALPSGKSVYVYDENTRHIGKAFLLMALGLVFAILVTSFHRFNS